MPPRVSVVIPAYQSAAYIGEALESVRAQTFTDYEIIVVNDGSPDTEALENALDPYMASVRYLNQANGGPGAARNRGTREARGHYVAYLDSDDLWLPDHLARQVELLESHASLGLVYSDSLLLRGDVPVGTAFERVPQDARVTFETLVAERCTIATSTVVASRQALLDAGGFENSRRRSEDFDLWLRLAHRGVAMRYSPGVQVCHRESNGLAADDNVMKQAQIDVYEKILSTLPVTGAQSDLLREKIREVQGRLQIEVMKQSLRAGRFQEGLAAARQANVALKSAKLSLVVAGLRFFPHGLRTAYCAYERFLERKESRRLARYRADGNEALSTLRHRALAAAGSVPDGLKGRGQRAS